MLDRVNYELPLGAIGELAHSLMVHRDLERVFDYRFAVIQQLFPAPAAARR
jgi:ligand-binding SRPBCC domain-containing protein